MQEANGNRELGGLTQAIEDLTERLSEMRSEHRQTHRDLFTEIGKIVPTVTTHATKIEHLEVSVRDLNEWKGGFWTRTLGASGGVAGFIVAVKSLLWK